MYKKNLLLALQSDIKKFKESINIIKYFSDIKQSIKTIILVLFFPYLIIIWIFFVIYNI
jgi:hypothetical protein